MGAAAGPVLGARAAVLHMLRMMRRSMTDTSSRGPRRCRPCKALTSAAEGRARVLVVTPGTSAKGYAAIR